MIVMVSTNTFSARLPDHSASTKPIEMTSGRPPFSTWFRVGTITLCTDSSVSARAASWAICDLMSSMVSTSKYLLAM
jgi:hypothetical protein